MTPDVATIFEPLAFRTLEVKNRVFRSSLAGRFNNYDGTGNQAHVNWDLKFARGGVGAIISSNAPVHPRGLIVPNYAHIDRDETDPLLARGRPARARARLPLHRPARLLGTAARHRRHPVREGLELDGQAGADPRAPSASA